MRICEGETTKHHHASFSDQITLGKKTRDTTIVLKVTLFPLFRETFFQQLSMKSKESLNVFQFSLEELAETTFRDFSFSMRAESGIGVFEMKETPRCCHQVDRFWLSAFDSLSLRVAHTE